MAACFVDRRNQERIEHSVQTLVGQRVLALALVYEDLNDHQTLRHDPLLAASADKVDGEALASAPRSTAWSCPATALDATTKCKWIRTGWSRCCCASECKAYAGANGRW